MNARFQSSGRIPLIEVLICRALGSATCSVNSISKCGWIASGPHDLLAFNFWSSFNIILRETSIFEILVSVLSSIIVISPSGSRVNTLVNCYCRILAFSSSSISIIIEMFYIVFPEMTTSFVRTAIILIPFNAFSI